MLVIEMVIDIVIARTIKKSTSITNNKRKAHNLYC